MPAAKLMSFLDEQGVKYMVIRHSPAYTAQEVASSAHIKGKDVAKTVMVKMDGEMAMAVLPASYRVDLKAMEKATGTKGVELATEKEFKDLFPQCETGAMPPFGNLYDMKVFVSKSLTEDDEIAFNAGTHMELVRMDYADFERLVKPTIAEFSKPRH